MHDPFVSHVIKRRLSACRVRWLLGAATAGLLGFAQSAHAAPDPGTCTGSGTTETCTFQGNQSNGISTSNTIQAVAILKVQDLSTDILGSIVLDRTTLRSLKTLDIDTGNYHIRGNDGITVTTNPFSLTQSSQKSKNGTPGLDLTLNFAGNLDPAFINNVADPQYAVLLNENGTYGFSFECGKTGCATQGGQGGAGANFDMFASGDILNAFYGVSMSSSGGRGGNGSQSSLNTAAGGNGGSGGAGGTQRFFTSGNLNIDTYSIGLSLLSFGAQGGLGGSGTTGGQGGNGGVGGLVSLDVGLGHTMTVNGVELGSAGGFGFVGGDNKSKQGLRGGNGAAGGNIDVTVDGTLWIEVDDAAGVNSSPPAGLYLPSLGGDGARGGVGDSNTAASDGGAGGNGGSITIALNNFASQALHIETLGLGQPGIEAFSVAGSGASASATGGKGQGGAGGSGGGGNLLASNSAIYISTAGDYSRGISFSSQGASGGTGSDGTYWVPTPGAGGSAGRGGSINLNLGDLLAPGSTPTSQITTQGTDSAAIFVESIGGGKAGDSGDPSAFGKIVSAGSSGDGGSVTVYLGSGVNLETHGMDSSGIAALSVGGSGGSGGNTRALFGTGGSGSIGGTGGSVYVNNAASIDTYGIASAGIRAQSLGGSGGNGGSATGGVTDLGGDAGSGGSGGTVHVVNTGTIYTHAAEGVDSTYINAPCVIGCAYGIFAQSVGGNGGMAGDAKAFSVTLGGGGGGGKSNGGLLTVDHSGNITTVQQSSAGIFAQSLGGSGGVSGATTAKGVLVTVAIGGDGGGGGDGGQVDVNLLNTATTITTTGEGSEGIKAASIGGGGGSSNITEADVLSAELGVAVGIGGNGAAGGAGGPVTISAGIDAASAAAGVTSVPVTIITYGDSSPGVDASSIGGGGGDSGYTGALAVVPGEMSLSVSAALGGSGGAGGAGGAVTVDFAQTALNIRTSGSYAYGIRAASTSDGGGTSGVTATLAEGFGELPINVGVSIGGSGGSGANSGAVTINTPAGGIIKTLGGNSYGIYASSISGGGGDAGTTFSVAAGQSVGGAISVPIAVGACATVDAKSCLAFSGDSGVVTVTNLSNVTTAGVRADGILASSKSGGGGNAGTVVTADLTIVVGDSAGVSADVSVGGNGGTSGKAGDVTVTNAGTIITTGPQAVGIYAESISGGGGSGSSAQNFSGSVNSIPISVNVGGKGGESGNAGNVTVTNHGEILTGILGAEDWLTVYNADGTLSSEIRQNEYGIFAQSLGGGGGEGGSTTSFDASLQTSEAAAFSAQVSVGGSGGTGGRAGTTTVTNDGTITTYSQSSDAIRALSWGGGGGTGGAAVNTLLALSAAAPSFRTSLTVGGAGGSGATGGNVIVTNEGTLTTSGTNSRGVSAESIGGGGGDAGVTGNVTYGFSSSTEMSTEMSVIAAVQVGGNGGTGNHGGAVTLNNSGTVSTGVTCSNFVGICEFGTGSAGLYARSIGGGGGSGGSTGASPDWNQTLEALGVSVTDVLDTLSAVSTFQSLFKDATALTVNVGGRAGAAGDGGLVTVTLDGGVINTYGFQSNGVEAYSIGGGGGEGGSGSGGITTIASVGGAGGAAGNGGDVTVTSAAMSSITTLGDSSHGIFAQSVGGGGGQAGDAPLSGVVDVFEEFTSDIGIPFNTDWASQGVGLGFSVPGTAGGGGDGGHVTIDVLTDIAASGYQSYGIFAQSVGGGGGTVGLSAWSVMDILTAGGATILNTPLSDLGFGPTETTKIYNGSTYGYGSGGSINIISRAAIATSGREAPGIYAQSAGGYTSPDDVFGNPSVGGDIFIDATDVSASGLYSAGIVAHSIGGNGNGNITILTRGLISGGTQAPAVQLLDGNNNSLTNLSGGTITCGVINEPFYTPTCFSINTAKSGNTVTIEDLKLTVPPGKIRSFTLTNESGANIIGDIVLSEVTDSNQITNKGIITGQVDLGPSCAGSFPTAFCAFDNYGTWNPGASGVSYSSVGSNSLNNFGTINITGATTIEGSLKNQTSGNLVLALDPNIHFDQPILTVTGLAQLDGSITPVISSLQTGEFKLLQAGTLAGTPQIADALLFNWQFSQSAGGTLGLSALSDFQPATIELTPNQRRLADYLTAAWENGELSLSGHFARLLAITSGDLYGSTLDAFSGAALLHQQTATLQALPTLLSDTLDCPTGGARSNVSEGSCLWIKGGHKWGRYSGGDTNRTDIGSDFYGFGGQKEIKPGWFLSASVGRLESKSMADGYGSSGDFTMASIGLKYQSGPWTLGAAFALASGSYDSVRRYTMPTVAGGGLIFSGSEFDLFSHSDLNVGSLRLQASREFAIDRFYVRPVLEIDLTGTRMPGFEEQGSAGMLTLTAAGRSQINYAATPHVEIGGVLPLGKESRLRMYLDLGVRLTPDANLEIDYTLEGVSERSGFARQVINVPLVTRVLQAGLQFASRKGPELRVEYELLDNGDLRSHSAAATLAWQF